MLSNTYCTTLYFNFLRNNQSITELHINHPFCCSIKDNDNKTEEEEQKIKVVISYTTQYFKNLYDNNNTESIDKFDKLHNLFKLYIEKEVLEEKS